MTKLKKKNVKWIKNLSDLKSYPTLFFGNEFLDDLFRTLEIQTFQDFEVVVSDHSKDDKLVDVIDEFQHKFNILYVKNKNNRGNGPANTNNAIDKCSGDIIKVMFQDLRTGQVGD